MIGSHTAFTKAAEAHIAGCQMYEDIVDAATAETTSGSNFPGIFFIFSEDIKSQRMCHGIDLCYGTSERVIGEDRKYRTEDFLLHDRIFEGYVIKNRRLDLKCFTVGTTAADSFGRIDQTVDTVEMLFVDDLSIIPVLQWFFSILACDLSAKLCDQGFFDLRITVDVVRSHAGLATVQKLAEYDTFCRKAEIGCFVHDAGAFSTQLQSDWCEVFGSLSHDLFSHRLASREEDVIKVQTEKMCVFRTSACDSCNVFFIETFMDEKTDHFTCCR